MDGKSTRVKSPVRFIDQIKDLTRNKLATISYEAFQNLPELEHLDMSYNKIEKFDFNILDQVGTLAMFHLNVSHNVLNKLVLNMPSTFVNDIGSGGYHSNIQVLDMSFNNISMIAKKFFRPAEISLTNLYLSHNRIINATRDVFGNMPHLQWLDLSSNHIYEMDFDMFRNTKKLQVLDVSHNRITDIPNDIFRFLANLRMVDISNNRIRALPDNLFREEGLEKLDLSSNLLSKMPLNSLAIPAAQTLCELDLSWNLISSLSHGGLLERFKKLNYLDLSYNRLAQIDVGTFKGLPRLLYLDLSHNSQLTLEPNGGSFKGLEYSLLHLKIDNVSLSIVPIFPTPNLVTLSLASNSLPSMPPEMATNMTNLQTLNLNYNSLTIVPILTHSLFELRVLTMVANQITYLSNTSLLGVADHLEELDIRNFDLTILEAGAFCKMYSLRTLKMNLYTGFKTFNIPTIIQWNTGLRNLEIHVDKQSDSDLTKELAGDFPPKLQNITFSGRGLKRIGAGTLQGGHSILRSIGMGLSNGHENIVLTGSNIKLVASAGKQVERQQRVLKFRDRRGLQTDSHSELIPGEIHEARMTMGISTVNNGNLRARQQKSHRGVLKDSNNEIITGVDEKLKRWKEYTENPFKDVRPDLLPDIDVINEMGPEITKEEVKHAIKLQKNARVGPDNVHVETFKLVAAEDGVSLDLITTIFNPMYRIGEIPAEWLRSTFVTSPKKNNASQCDKYRMISLMSMRMINTSIIRVPGELFKNIGSAKNLTVDVRDNKDLKSLMNPSTGPKPDLFKKTFLKDLKIMGNRWDCDCDLGWIEVWQRKHRQYICEDSPSIAPYFNHFGYICKHTRDDLRMSLCANKNNNSVVEVLKADIECGWSSGSKINGLNLVFTIWVGVVLRSLL
ncbi:hypothetical protein HUJ05_001861 [Dendroctonus ponderosae]|nr:hypothetical protein HUJ05_001861 [Dendroctonus ponderosae]